MFIANAYSEERVIEFVNGAKERRVLGVEEVLEGKYEGKKIRMNGTVHAIRHIGKVAFVVLRKSRGLAQCVHEAGDTDFDIRDLKEESTMGVMGVVKTEERMPQGFEVRLKEIRVLPQPAKPLPLAVSKWKLSTSLETRLSLRPISLCNMRERAKFKIQEGIIGGFRDYPLSQDFTEICTSKVMTGGAEGNSNIFKLEYFNKRAELGQSPQFYKQTMAGVCDRVFETAPVFQTEKHNTTHHLSKYTNLGFGIGYIDSFRDVIDMKMGMLQYIMRLLGQEYKEGLDMLGVALPEVGRIPAVRFDQTKELVSRRYDGRVRNPYDLEPEEELLIGWYFKKECESNFAFVTHYPSKRRPFYAVDDPENPKSMLNFDPMLRGLEVTTGGQRIHDYRGVTDEMERRGMGPEDIAPYLMILKYGVLSHDGLGIELRCFTMRLLGE